MVRFKLRHKSRLLIVFAAGLMGRSDATFAREKAPHRAAQYISGLRIPTFQYDSPGAKRLGYSCQEFIRPDGTYGRIGRSLVSSMKKAPYRQAFLDNEFLTPYCPNFKRMSHDQKLRAWTWFWMVLANEESTCSVEAVHPTHTKVNGRWVRLNPKAGYGLFAAEYYAGDRRWRGPACSGDIKDPKRQVTCAVDTMYSVHLEKRASRDTASYWGPVRRERDQIKPNMKLYSPCFAKSRATAKRRG